MTNIKCHDFIVRKKIFVRKNVSNIVKAMDIHIIHKETSRHRQAKIVEKNKN